MSEYLCFRCGPHRLLLAIAHVVELGDAPEAATDQAGRRLWRGQSLPLLDLAARLGVPRARRPQQVVVDDGAGTRCIVEVAAVEDLREIAPAAFAGIAAVSPALAALVDGVAFDAATGDCLLRLRPAHVCHPESRAEESPA